MYQHILVALDGSRCAERALDEALKIATPAHTSVTLVYVVEHIPQMEDLNGDPLAQPPLDTQAVDLATRALEHARLRVAQKSLAVEVRTLDAYGETVAEILQGAARACHADLVVMGTHGRRSWQHFLLGSVAEAFLKLAEAPVLLVRDSTPNATAV